MKLPIAQFNKIKRALDDARIPEGNWALIKRKGRIRLEVEGHIGFFEFFKRKSVQIDEHSHAWVKAEHFEILTEHGPSMVGDWEEVLRALRTWLSENSRKG